MGFSSSGSPDSSNIASSNYKDPSGGKIDESPEYKQWLETRGGTEWAAQAQVDAAANPDNGTFSLVNLSKSENMQKEFLAWKARQEEANSSFNKYTAALTQQPGRDQNILTGPTLSPNANILGGR